MSYTFCLSVVIPYCIRFDEMADIPLKKFALHLVYKYTYAQNIFHMRHAANV